MGNDLMHALADKNKTQNLSRPFPEWQNGSRANGKFEKLAPFLVSILRALQQSRAQEARRVIIQHAHLLPEEVRAADILPFIASDQGHVVETTYTTNRRPPKISSLWAIILVVVGTIFFLWEVGSFPPIDFTLGLKMFSVFVGAVVAGVAGFAFSAVAGAILLHWVAPVTAVPLLLICSITTQLMSITRLWRTMRWRECMPFLIGGFVGIPIGAKLLEDLDAHVFAGAFGICLIGYGGYMLLRPKTIALRGSRLVDVVVGLAGGITGGSFAFPGAAPTIWCSIRGFAKDEQRGIVQPFILLMQVATLFYFSRFGLIASGMSSTFLMCAPVVVIGTWLGLHFFSSIGDAMFRQLVLIFLIFSGVFLVL
jgi:hypothetical protein